MSTLMYMYHVCMFKVGEQFGTCYTIDIIANGTASNKIYGYTVHLCEGIWREHTHAPTSSQFRINTFGLSHLIEVLSSANICQITADFTSQYSITADIRVSDCPSLCDLIVRSMQSLKHVETKSPQQTCAVGGECENNRPIHRWKYWQKCLILFISLLLPFLSILF